MTKLLVATRNKGKVDEYADMLSDLGISWVSLDDIGLDQEVDESGDTFEANAQLKAATYAAASGLLTLADDSGLEVNALEGAPGVKTARYGGTGLSSKERYEFLLQNLRDIPAEERKARFVCVIALAAPDGEILTTADGEVAGVIALSPSGEGGFGYDPVFYLPDRRLTMAQLSPQEKHAISHRGRALKAIEPSLRDILRAT